MTTKQLVRLGVFHIEEAILEILSKAGDEFVRAVEIERACGLFESWDKSHWVVSSVLNKLEEGGRVQSRSSGSGWRRTGWRLTLLEQGRRA